MEFTKEETDILRSCLDGNISKISELPIDSQYKLLYYIDNVLKNDDLFNNIYKFLDFNLGEESYIHIRDNLELIDDLDVNEQKHLKDFIGFEVWIANVKNPRRARLSIYEVILKYMVDKDLGNDEIIPKTSNGGRRKSKRRKSKRRKSKRRKSKRRKVY